MDTVTAPAQAAYEVVVQRQMIDLAAKAGDMLAALQEIEEHLVAGRADDALVRAVAVLDRWNPKVGA